MKEKKYKIVNFADHNSFKLMKTMNFNRIENKIMNEFATLD